MEVIQESLGPVKLLRPRGNLDVTTSAAFETRLLEAVASGEGKPMVVIDLSGVPFISSAGLRAVMVGAKRARSEGGSLAVADLTDVVREIFEISRFHHVVPVFDGVREAVASMSEDAAAALDEG